MGMAQVPITGSSPDGTAGMKSTKMQLWGGALVTLKPFSVSAVMAVTGNRGALANPLREIGAVISEPTALVVSESQPTKLKRVTSGVTRKQMWNSCAGWCPAIRNKQDRNFRNVSLLAKCSGYEENSFPLHPTCHLTAGHCLTNANAAEMD